MKTKHSLCPLCSSKSTAFYNEQFQKCSVCQSVFRLKKYFLSPEAEKDRYETHNNDIYDLGYQSFVSPLVKEIQNHHNTTTQWLDYWAGPGPVAAYMLETAWFTVRLYDPFFYPDTSALKEKYDFIILSEVAEHFYTPLTEFQKLYHLLKSWWQLYMMTDMYHEDINFKAWYYKNDPTHVFFYHVRALKWICDTVWFTRYTKEGRLVIFEKQ